MVLTRVEWVWLLWREEVCNSGEERGWGGREGLFVEQGMGKDGVMKREGRSGTGERTEGGERGCLLLCKERAGFGGLGSGGC